jgi:hypothetical protein
MFVGLHLLHKGPWRMMVRSFTLILAFPILLVPRNWKMLERLERSWLLKHGTDISVNCWSTRSKTATVSNLFASAVRNKFSVLSMINFLLIQQMFLNSMQQITPLEFGLTNRCGMFATNVIIGQRLNSLSFHCRE